MREKGAVHSWCVWRDKCSSPYKILYYLVDMLVEEGDVHQSMGVVEPDVADHVADKNMAKG